MHSKILFKTLFLFLFLLFSILLICRDSNLISDGPNYISHALNYNIDYSLPEFYGYISYWFIADNFGGFFGEFFPSFLCLLILIFLLFSINQLNVLDRYIIMLFMLLNPLIFVSMFVALKTGLAISILLLGISFKSKIFSITSATVHPGIIPVIIFEKLCNIKKYNFKTLVLFFITLIISFFLLQKINFVNELLSSRGYSEIEEVKEKWYVYGMYFILAILYFFSFRKSNYKFLFILMFFLWFIVGNYYPFAWRLFSQSLLILLYILLSFSDNKEIKSLFLILFFILSLHSAIKWHPFIEYKSGFYDFWVSFF